jgi:holo-[acyl-carrier protein] synthase
MGLDIKHAIPTIKHAINNYSPPIKRAKLRPFPLPFSIGTDICHIPRIAALLQKDGLRFVRRVLHERELKAYDVKITAALEKLRDDTSRDAGGMLRDFRKEGGQDSGTEASSFEAWMAGRWAVKEAAIKAYGWRRLYLRDVVVLEGKARADGGRGAPVAFVAPVKDAKDAREVDGEDEIWEEVKVSISHDGEFATAVCMAANGAAVAVKDGLVDLDDEWDT